MVDKILMTMEKEFVTYEVALTLKELGFDEDCLAFYVKCEESNICIPMLRVSKIEAQKIIDSVNNIYNAEYILAPLKQQVFRWFREKYGFYHLIYPAGDDYGNLVFRTVINNINVGLVMSYAYPSYEEAENFCIDKFIELAKKQKDGKN
jgi:hypothetical protein